MPYSKPFRELSDLVLELEALGMAVPDKPDAESFLRKVGYYRSGGYRYVLREFLPQDRRDSATRTFRAERYFPGSTFAHVQQLEKFDSKLREVCLAGLWDFEMRVRAALAHTLARRDVFAHTDIRHLDRSEALKMAGGQTKFDAWEETYRSAIRGSSQEDFVAHLLVKYGHPLPIWAVVDVLRFGSLPYLYEIAQRADRLEVANAFGAACMSTRLSLPTFFASIRLDPRGISASVPRSASYPRSGSGRRYWYNPLSIWDSRSSGSSWISGPDGA